MRRAVPATVAPMAALAVVVTVYAVSSSENTQSDFVANPPDQDPYKPIQDTNNNTQTVFAASSLSGTNATIPHEIVNTSNVFAADFYRLVSGGNDNIFFSPLSMYTAFSMLYEGAKGETAEQIRAVFDFEADAGQRHNMTAHAIASLNRDDPHATLELANSLWIADRFSPYDSYVDTVKETYLAESERVNFTDTGDAGGVSRINGWASEKTYGKIPKVLSPNDVNETTVVTLLNAIYFKGTWVTQFPAEDTAESDFWKTGTQSIRTDFMNVRETFDYAELDGVQVIRLPYKGDRLSMLVVLPPADKMTRLEESVSAEQISRWNQNMRTAEVIVSMPKFEMKTNYDLIPLMEKLGMRNAFAGSADLSGIVQTPPNLHVSKAVQDAYVKVNEEGTEAAAVTTIVVLADSVQPVISRFTADHPFMFLIQDDESGAILFMGRVSDPSAG